MTAAEKSAEPVVTTALANRVPNKISNTVRRHTHWTTGGLLLCAAALLLCPGCIMFTAAAGFSIEGHSESLVSPQSTPTPITKLYADKTGSKIMAQYSVTYKHTKTPRELWLCIDFRTLNKWVLNKQQQPNNGTLIDTIIEQDSYSTIVVDHSAAKRFIYSLPSWRRPSLIPLQFMTIDTDNLSEHEKFMQIQYNSSQVEIFEARNQTIGTTAINDDKIYFIHNRYQRDKLVCFIDLPATSGLDQIEIPISMRNYITPAEKTTLTSAIIADLVTWPIQLIGIGGIVVVDCIKDVVPHHRKKKQDKPVTDIETEKAKLAIEMQSAPLQRAVPSAMPKSVSKEISTTNTQQQQDAESE